MSGSLAAEGRAAAAHLDDIDPLGGLREQFILPAGVIYLDGNSLGPVTVAARERVAGVVSGEWATDLVNSWNVHDWIGLPALVGDKIADLIGAGPGEVVVADSTSVNVFKLLSAALKLRPNRRIILTTIGNFPTDVYIAQGLVDLLGGRYELVRVPPEELAGAVNEETAVVMATHVDFVSGRIFDMDEITASAHRAGALMLWDLSHSAGALPVDLNRAGADLAVGCGYKYLNGGPGAPSFLFVAERHLSDVAPALSGWLGHDDPFEFADDYRPAAGVGRFVVGTPPVLSLVALDAALSVIGDVDIVVLRRKSLALTGMFIDLVERRLEGAGFVVASPRDPTFRGSQVTLRHPEGFAIMQALIARNVIGDFRAPDAMRFGFAPLYVRYVDVWDAVTALEEVMTSGEWRSPRHHERRRVT